ncbi:MAG: Trm112 family protein [Gemmataceae bacterium]
MIAPELLEILRCPMDPSNTRVTLDGDRLVCERCRLRFPIKDGLPIMVVEEAELPADCSAVEQLPCQRGESS